MTKKDPDSVSNDSNDELEALRKRVNELEQAADAAEQDDDGITKRGLVKAAWAAPVIMSVNLPNAVFAQPAMSPGSVPMPTLAPGTTAAPTRSPTGAPTAPPTNTPTASPTPLPSVPVT
ncbi:MAG: hypothetical protein NXI27_20890 [Alphaproteobacteria bacterium]|nr:hypothetical protein [Alphaproteobacteria bacterium]